MIKFNQKVFTTFYVVMICSSLVVNHIFGLLPLLDTLLYIVMVVSCAIYTSLLQEIIGDLLEERKINEDKLLSMAAFADDMRQQYPQQFHDVVGKAMERTIKALGEVDQDVPVEVRDKIIDHMRQAIDWNGEHNSDYLNQQLNKIISERD